MISLVGLTVSVGVLEVVGSQDSVCDGESEPVYSWDGVSERSNVNDTDIVSITDSDSDRDSSSVNVSLIVISSVSLDDGVSDMVDPNELVMVGSLLYDLERDRGNEGENDVVDSLESDLDCSCEGELDSSSERVTRVGDSTGVWEGEGRV